MKTFIRVVELWVPDRTGTRLEFGGSLCGAEFSEFRALSENALFAYDEGLPGKAWAAGHPIILTKFADFLPEALRRGQRGWPDLRRRLSGLCRRIPHRGDGAVLRR